MLVIQTTYLAIKSSPLPPPSVFHCILEAVITLVAMSKSTLTEVEERRSQHIIETKDESKNVAVDQEIECPRCHDIMTLQSDFDRICYLCEECDFLLNLN